MSNINTLRQHLFETLSGLKDGTITVEKAKAVGEIAQVITNTAKLEVDFLRANKGGKSDFLQVSATPNATKTPTGFKSC